MGWGGVRREGQSVCDVFLRIKEQFLCFLDARLILVLKLGTFLTEAPIQAFLVEEVNKTYSKVVFCPWFSSKKTQVPKRKFSTLETTLPLKNSRLGLDV